MIKKLTLLAMAITALVAFAVPAVASAEITGVETGQTIVAKSGNTKTVTPAGTLECASVELEGELTENGSTVKIANVVARTTTICNLNGNPVVHLTEAKAGTITLNSGGTGTISNVTFVSDIGPNVSCHFSASSLGITWNSGGVKVTNGVLSATGILGKPCATSSGEISGDFKLFNLSEEELSLM